MRPLNGRQACSSLIALRAIAFLGAGLLVTSCSVPTRAQDGATLYRSKCLACHGPTGAGRPAIKGTDLLTEAAKKATDAELTESIAHGGKNKNAAHAYEDKGVTRDQVQTLVKYVRELQSKQQS
jgi:mono/diheme cytochrome c family protein